LDQENEHRPRQDSEFAPGTEAVAQGRRIAAGQTVSEPDQTVSELDQTVSEVDQTASDSDQTASDRDQAQAEADQRTSNRDQAAADHERAARAPQEGPSGVYEAARAERRAGTFERAETGLARAETAAYRDEHSGWRDEHARVRDRAADQRDRAATGSYREQEPPGPSSDAPRDRAASMRANAADSRVRAAADRERAAADRAAAAHDRELARAELRDVQARKMQAVGELAGGIAHEFNNLLMIVSGYARALATRADVAAAREDAEEIMIAAERAAKLTRQLLTFAHRSHTSPSLLDLSQTMADLERPLQSVVAARIRLHFLLDHGTHRVLMDRAQFEEMIMNLILNASDAMPGGGTITVTSKPRAIDEQDATTDAGKPDDYSMVSVSDTGAGIPADVRGRIFEPFFTTKRPEGSGMGLATAYAIVEEAGGWIDVETEVGTGTTFSVTLPAA
jgi:signal transduction histidine kinase